MRECSKVMLVCGDATETGAFLNVEVDYLVSIISPSIQMFMSRDSRC